LNEFNPVVHITIFHVYVFIFIYFYPSIMIFCYIMHIINIVVNRVSINVELKPKMIRSGIKL